MTKQKNQSKEHSLPKWFYGIIIFIVLLIIYALLLMNGQVRYMEAYVKCGWQRPILAEIPPKFDGGKITGKHYTLPSEGYHIPKAVDILGSATYYCSEGDAIADGYTHSK